MGDAMLVGIGLGGIGDGSCQRLKTGVVVQIKSGYTGMETYSELEVMGTG